MIKKFLTYLLCFFAAVGMQAQNLIVDSTTECDENTNTFTYIAVISGGSGEYLYSLDGGDPENVPAHPDNPNQGLLQIPGLLSDGTNVNYLSVIDAETNESVNIEISEDCIKTIILSDYNTVCDDPIGTTTIIVFINEGSGNYQVSLHGENVNVVPNPNAQPNGAIATVTWPTATAPEDSIYDIEILDLTTNNKNTLHMPADICKDPSNPDTPPVFSNVNAASTDNATALITWTGSNETTVDYYVIQTSTDSINFTSIDTLQTLSGTAANTYTFSDTQPAEICQQYYQILWVDNSGTVHNVSNAPLSVTINEFCEESVSLYLNPNTKSNGVQIKLIDTENAKLRIFDVLGQLAREENNIPNGVYSMEQGTLSEGIYILHISTAQKEYTFKVQLFSVK